MKKYDLAVIGSGPGGYVAAIYAARQGLEVCVVENQDLGGTCLNKGCIPTKTLIASARMRRMIDEAPSFGIRVDSHSLDTRRVLERKDEVVNRLRAGIGNLFKARNITVVKGRARLNSSGEIEVNDGAEKAYVTASHIIIAVGSVPVEIPSLKFDHKDILSTDDVTGKDSIIGVSPGEIAIVGGGVMGCEFAQVFSQLGWKVSITEMEDRLLPGIDRQAARRLEAIMKKEGIRINLGSKAQDCLQPGAKVLVCAGRRPNIEGLRLEDCGIEAKPDGIVVDETLRTSKENIYAIGDCIGGNLLAHVASYEGITAVKNILGAKERVDYRIVPNSIFTYPEIAYVGLSEEAAQARGYEIKTGRFNFGGLGASHCFGDMEGFVKLFGDANTDRILGGVIMGPHSANLMQEIALAIRLNARVADVAEMIRSHPTFAEAVGEAAADWYDEAIHSL